MLYEQATYTYPEYLDLLAEAGGDRLLQTFQVLADDAVDALLRLQDMNGRAKPAQNLRKAAITALRRLTKDLQDAEGKLSPAAGGKGMADRA